MTFFHTRFYGSLPTRGHTVLTGFHSAIFLALLVSIFFAFTTIHLFNLFNFLILIDLMFYFAGYLDLPRAWDDERKIATLTSRFLKIFSLDALFPHMCWSCCPFHAIASFDRVSIIDCKKDCFRTDLFGSFKLTDWILILLTHVQSSCQQFG